MIPVDEILVIAKQFAAIQHEAKENHIPPYSPQYVIAVKHANELMVHADGKFPAELLAKKAPNEHEEEFLYRRENYQAETKPVWALAKKAVNRIWNPMNYSVEWASTDKNPKQKNDPPQEYFENLWPVTGNIYLYFANIITDQDLKDPNAVIAVKPRKLPLIDDGDGNLKVDDSELIEPFAKVYNSKEVIDHNEEYTLIELPEKAQLKDGEGLIYELYDEINIWRITQTGEKADFTFKAEIFWAHNLDFVPVRKLVGIATQIEGVFINESFFAPALPSLNNAAMDSSTLFASKAKMAFPRTWEITSECPNEKCNGGMVWDEEEAINFTCNQCNGTGRSKASPLTTKEIPLPAALSSTDLEAFKAMPTPPMGVQDFPTEGLTFLRKEIDINTFDKAFSFVSIDLSKTMLRGNETATGKTIEREELFSFLMLISKELFALLKWTINTCGKMRYESPGDTEEFIPPTISPPVDFKVRSEAELLEEIGNARDKGLPPSVIRRLYKQYFGLRFGSTIDAEQITKLLFFADSQITKTDLQITTDLTTRRIQGWMKVIHDQYEVIIAELMMDNDKFFSTDNSIETQREAVETSAKAKAAIQITPTTGGTTEGILAAANQGT